LGSDIVAAKAGADANKTAVIRAAYFMGGSPRWIKRLQAAVSFAGSKPFGCSGSHFFCRDAQSMFLC
jgi:hypothetical protein